MMGKVMAVRTAITLFLCCSTLSVDAFAPPAYFRLRSYQVSQYSKYAFDRNHPHNHHRRFLSPVVVLLRSSSNDDNEKTPAAAGGGGGGGSGEQNPNKQLSTNTKNLDGSIKSYIDQVIQNITQGKFGERGETYSLLQVALVLFIVFGRIPLIERLVEFLLGPGAIVLGMITIYSALKDIGKSISPYPVPIPQQQGGSLTTSGIYGQLRHPMYSGLLCVMLGGSVLSDSAMRIVFTVLLYFSLDLKANYEEEKMMEMYPQEYVAYKANVPNKYVPKAFVSWLKGLTTDESTK